MSQRADAIDDLYSGPPTSDELLRVAVTFLRDHPHASVEDFDSWSRRSLGFSVLDCLLDNEYEGILNLFGTDKVTVQAMCEGDGP